MGNAGTIINGDNAHKMRLKMNPYLVVNEKQNTKSDNFRKVDYLNTKKMLIQYMNPAVRRIIQRKKFLNIQFDDSDELEFRPIKIITNDNKYLGHWNKVSNTIQGQGLLVRNDGSLYEGIWDDNQLQGKIRYIDDQGNYYTGQWSDGKRDGFGTQRWINGDKYTGEWINNKQSGEGTYTWANNERYEGKWVNDQRDIYGCYTWTDGDIYKG